MTTTLNAAIGAALNRNLDRLVRDHPPSYNVIASGPDWHVGDFRDGFLVDKDCGWRTAGIARLAARLYTDDPWLFGEDRSVVLAALTEFRRAA